MNSQESHPRKAEEWAKKKCLAAVAAATNAFAGENDPEKIVDVSHLENETDFVNGKARAAFLALFANDACSVLLVRSMPKQRIPEVRIREEIFGDWGAISHLDSYKEEYETSIREPEVQELYSSLIQQPCQ